ADQSRRRPRRSRRGAGVSERRMTSGSAGLQMQFDDNTLLPLLFGERDQHLDRIERQLGVSLVSRGNRVAITGPAASADRARTALTTPYERLKRGLEVDPAAVD